METLNHQEVFVCFLDVLGFKDLIENNDHVTLDRIFDSKIMGFVNILAGQEMNRSEKDTINFLSVSDSIILWSNNTSDNSLFRIINHTKSILISCLQHGVPLRGAISRGPLSVKKQNGQTIIIGKALTKAYSTESKQNWSGCIIDRDCLAENSRREYLFKKRFIYEYQVPYKSGRVTDEIVIDWVSSSLNNQELYDNDITEEFIRDSFGRHNKKTNDWSIKTKVDNTVEFYRKVTEDLQKA